MVHLASLTRIKGQVVMVAMPKDLYPVDLGGFALKEIDLAGCRAYNASDFRAAIALIAEDKIDVEPLVSHVLPRVQASQGLELATAGESLKVLLRPQADDS